MKVLDEIEIVVDSNGSWTTLSAVKTMESTWRSGIGISIS